uniref:Predicted protein n=1 Tax=Hordeum vulgare subsp. vulgare TaxID=112509 RepID=F2CQU1_HORVV|nr:predicted protein [Hordeum vulgare subsp. vulgare]
MAASARVPDLGSDFAQKMLQDLRRRRERLGFGSPSAQQQQRTASTAAATATASRDACSNSQRPAPSQRPQQAAAAPRSTRPEATTTPRQPSTSNAVLASAARPRRVRPVAAADADARAIVPFQGGGGGAGGGKPEHAVVASGVDVQMAALALALSDGGKLRNIEVVARNGSVFFRQPDAARLGVGGGGGYLLPPPPSGGDTGAHAAEVAIGVQGLNDMLMAAYSSGGRRRPDDEARKKLFRGSMDMEEALSMLVMVQDASRYMEGSGSGLKGKENRKSSPAARSARIEEIVDEDSDAEHGKHASMQMVVHDKFQSHESADSRSVIQSSPGSSKINSASGGEKDGSKVRMPSVIAKLMGLENLPSSTTTTTAAERKGTERFVKPGAAAPRMEVRGNAMDRKLPIRIIASEKGQHKIVLAGEWKNGMTNFGESEMGAAALSNSSSHPATGNSKQGRLTMREVLRKMVAAERGADERQVADERIIHEDKTAAEEIKLQNSVDVGCRADSGKRMDFLKRFRKNSDNRPVKEEKQTAQVKNAEVGKKQATGMRRLLGRDGEAKSRKAREKVNKENLATAETKAAGKNVKADQMRKQAQSKHVERQITARKPQNRRETQRETPSRKTENKKSVMSEAGHMRKKPEYNLVTQQDNEEHAKEHDSFSKPADSTHGEGGLSEPLAIVVRSSSIAGAASLDQPLQKITEGSTEKATETPREPQNCRGTQSETPSRKLENKKLPLSEAGHMRKNLEYTVVAQHENEGDANVNCTISSSKPADSTNGEGGLWEPSTMVVRDSTTAEAASLDKPLQKITEGTSDPTVPAESVVQASEDLKFLDQSASAEINDERINHTPSETTQIPEIFAEEEQQQEQEMIVKEQLTEDLKFLDQSTIPETNDEQINHTPDEATEIPETFAEEEQQQQQQERDQQMIVIPETFSEMEEQQQQMIVKEQLTDGSDHTTASISSENLQQDQETHVVTCDSLTENQLLLMRLLVKDRYLLETAKSIVRVDAPVSFMDDVASAPNWSDKGNELLSDVAREVTRRKGKRSEAMEEVSVARATNPRLRYLDDLVRELDGDVESLDMSKSKSARHHGDNGAAENLRRILEGDIQNEHPDANSTWDFGWNRVWELPLEKADVVRDLEKNILGGIITDVARDLIGVSVRHGCCPCVA